MPRRTTKGAYTAWIPRVQGIISRRMNDKRERWTLLEAKLEALAATKAPSTKAVEQSMMREYIEHREYGLALEEFVAVVVTTKEPLKSGTLEAIGELARLMEMDERELIELFRPA